MGKRSKQPDSPAAAMRAALPHATVIERPDGLVVIEPRSDRPERADSLLATARAERKRPADLPDSILKGGTLPYHQSVELIARFREVNPAFDHLCFVLPRQLAVTRPKCVVGRPQRIDKEEAFEQIERRVSPPFVEFNQNVNAHLAETGKSGGAMEVASWCLDHLLEGGLVGWAAAMDTVAINGVKWRTIREIRTYSGRQLGCDKKNATFRDEQWYVRRPDGQHRSQLGGYQQGWDQTTFDATMWDAMVSNPAEGVYRGVAKYAHAEGGEDKYPRPPYVSLLRSLVGHELLLRDDLRTLQRHQGTFVIWSFNHQVMADQGIPWASTRSSDGQLQKGGYDIFLDRRREILDGAAGGTEIGIPNFVEYKEVSPGLELLLALEKYRAHDRPIERRAGIWMDEEGRYLEVESNEQRESSFQYNREQCLELLFNHWYRLIWQENVEHWARLNGAGAVNPFLFVSAKAARLLKQRTPPTPAGQQKRHESLLLLRLDGEIEDVQVRFAFAPSAAKRSTRAKELLTAAQQGLLPAAYYQEGAGFDPADARNEKLLQMRDRVAVDPSLVDLWSAPTGFTQRAEMSGNAMTTTGSEVSPGRPSEGGTDATGG